MERTFSLVAKAVGTGADGRPGEVLSLLCDDLVEASVPDEHRAASTAVAVDWSDHPTWACPPTSAGGPCADPDASWDHRRGRAPGARDELFFGYYPQVVAMVRDEHGPPVPELVRRLVVTSCHVDPPRALVPVIERMAASGVAVGDVLADSGYAHRDAGAWPLPLRRLGAQLVQDRHPHDRGPKGTWADAVIANGSLYCPATPPALLELRPLPAGANRDEVVAHDARTAELAHYKLGRISGPDADGYHRVACPATAAKLRCPLRAPSMSLGHDRPEVLASPEAPPRCCTQRTVTVPPAVNAKTAQKHDYPSVAHRRRTGSERVFSALKDPASTDTRRGWCRVMGLTAITLFLTCAVIVRNQRVLVAFERRQNEALAVAGQPATRRRRRRTLDDLCDEPAP